MERRGKKPPVSPKARRDWLRRFEENGESVPTIAAKDGYDVRTVRKQLELARQDREGREARSVVLRQALEQHYADLVTFAEKLRAWGTNPTLPPGVQSDVFWAALQQHLPRSPVWKAIDTGQRLTEEVRAIEQRAGERMRQAIDTKSPVAPAARRGEAGLYLDGLAEAVNYHLREEKARGLMEFRPRPVTEGRIEVSYGSWSCALVANAQVPAAQEFIANLMAGVADWPESADMRRAQGERRRVTNDVADELTTLILRRVVPGRCKYCPV